MKVTRLYIKFVNTIFKDMNMKDYNFDSDLWKWSYSDRGITITTQTEKQENYEEYFIPWNNIVVTQIRCISRKTS